jgi:hypothetical protein
MGFKRDENRGKKLGSRFGGWNPPHKLISKEERANLRQDLETRAGSTLSKIQQKFSKIIAKDEQLKCIKEAVEVVFGFQGKPEQVESIWSLLVEREDRIFVAKTGYRKSVVPQLLPYYKELYCHCPAAVECTWRRTIRGYRETSFS